MHGSCDQWSQQRLAVKSLLGSRRAAAKYDVQNALGGGAAKPALPAPMS
eukprot:COSAG02_NODE_31022_length_540_cov_2.437642_1_plen_48_part_10